MLRVKLLQRCICASGRTPAVRLRLGGSGGLVVGSVEFCGSGCGVVGFGDRPFECGPYVKVGIAVEDLEPFAAGREVQLLLLPCVEARVAGLGGLGLTDDGVGGDVGGGLDDTTETPVVGDDSVTVADRITVTPAEATCTATPAGATVTVGGLPSGTARWVSLDVPADSTVTVTVTVTCSHGEASAAASASFTANRAPEAGECDDPLGTLRGASVSRLGRLDSSTGCRSLGRYGSRGSSGHYAGRHTFTVTVAGWVTIDLEATSRGRDWIDAYLVLMNGADPAGGVVLERNDDSGSGFNSRIVRRYLEPGRYTIEATTFSRRDSGRYRLTVAADYRAQAPVHPALLRVRNGTTATSTWGYRPATAAVALASAFPDGNDASVSAAAGTATLTATPSRVGQYAVLVSYTNGPTSFTRSTTIDSYCPDGQIELPGDCGLPRTVRTPHIPFRLVFHPDDARVPEGYEDANYCAGVQLAASKWRYACRTKPVIQRTFISKSDTRILGVSEPYSNEGTNHGRTILRRSPDDVVEGREGCQAVTAKVWQCDYRTSHFWSIELDSIGSGDLIDSAMRKFLIGQAQATGRIAQCAAAILEVMASLRQGTLDPQAGASVATDCPEAGPTGP